MKICKVNSLPLKDVINSLADSLGVSCSEKCGEYFLDVPSSFGKGQIRGINFDNGFGIIIYKCIFKKDVRIDFTVDDVHPIKYLYSVKGPVTHSFANENKSHKLVQNKCAIVASESRNGHVLFFEKNIDIEIVSLEIDRKKFLVNSSCEIKDLAIELQDLFNDQKASKTFYHDGFYGLDFNSLLADISKYEEKSLIRKFYLESLSLQIFVNQLEQYEDDLLNDSERTMLRVNELNRVQEAANYITNHLTKDLSIAELTRKTGLNPNKLQMAFKYLYRKTVNEYVVNVRLEKAIVLLGNKDLSVSDVVARIGIENNSYFSKIFKNKYGVSPSTYKKSLSKH